jgi:hypothetical protein
MLRWLNPGRPACIFYITGLETRRELRISSNWVLLIYTRVCGLVTSRAFRGDLPDVPVIFFPQGRSRLVKVILSNTLIGLLSGWIGLLDQRVLSAYGVLVQLRCFKLHGCQQGPCGDL